MKQDINTRNQKCDQNLDKVSQKSKVRNFGQKKRLHVCKLYLVGKCNAGKNCKFYHPVKTHLPQGKIIQRKTITRRQSGYCYCGHKIKCIINAKIGGQKRFYTVCSRTNHTISNCLYYASINNTY